MDNDIWTILGIRATTDISAIKKAYAARARECHPEENPQGFLALHEAYSEAIQLATRYGKDSGGEETPAPKTGAFRAAPANLRKLDQTGQPAADNNEDEERERPVSPEADVYSFPDPAETGPEETPGQGGELSFPKGETAGSTPPLEEEKPASGYDFTRSAVRPSGEDQPAPAEEAPGYDFSRPAARPAGEDPPGTEDQENKPAGDPGYRFPRNSPPDAPPVFGPAPGRVATAGPEPVIFPGFSLMGAGADAGLPFMPLLMDSPQEEYYPQTKEEQEHLLFLENARKYCLDEMKSLVEAKAPEQAWYPLLLSADFTLVQYSGKFVLDVLRLCQKDLPLEMASALYMAYGFTSARALRKYPMVTPLFNILNQLVQLPQEDIAFLSLSENLHKSDMTLAGLARLCSASQEAYICGQAVRGPGFVHVRHQPYFVARLAAFLKDNDLADQWRQALAWAYQLDETPESPCLKLLAGELPVAAAGQDYGEYTPLADGLLRNEAALPVFMDETRKSLMELLEKTARGFARSARPGPWEYVFNRPEFRLLRRDGEFLYQLLLFLGEKKLPPGIWPALARAFSLEFAGLPQDKSAIPEPGPDLSPEERTTLCLALLKDSIDNHDDTPPVNPSFREILKSMLASI